MRIVSRTSLGLLVVGLAALVACGRDPERAKKEYLQKGDGYASQQNFDAAIIEYRNAIQQDAKFGTAYLKLGAAYLKKGDVRNGLGASVRAADLLPKDEQAQLQAGNLLLLAGRYEDAKARAKSALAIDAGSVAAQILLGNSLAGLKQFDAAIAEIEQAVRLAPDRSATYAQLGFVRAASGDREHAEAAFKEAIARDPKSVTARLALAQFYWLVGRLPEVEQTLINAVALDKDHLTTNRALAAFYMASNRPRDAEAPLRRYVQLDGSAGARLTLADYLARQGRNEEAVRELHAILNDPHAGSLARVRLAALDYQAGRVDQALAALDSMLAAKPSDTAALTLKANIRLSQKQLDDALALAERAAKSDPSSAEARFTLARTHEARREFDAAIEAFNEVLKLNPRAAAAEVALARLHLNAGAADTSVSFAAQAVRTEPRNVAARLVLARGLMSRGDLLQAEQLLTQLDSAYPNRAPIVAQLGLVSSLKKDVAGAARHFERALALDPYQPDAVRGMVGVKLSRRDADGARQLVDGLAGKAPANTRILMIAAQTHAALREWSSAEGLLRQAIAADPSMVPAYGLLAHVLLAQNRLDEALKEYQDLARREPKPVAALTMCAMILQAQGRHAEAQKTYERVLEMDPRAGVAANNLAWIYAENGSNLDIALQHAQTAKAALPDQAEVNDTLGWIYYKKNLLPLAISALNRSIELDASRPEFYYHLGLAYAKSGDDEHARRFLERCLALDPKFPKSTEIKQQLAALEG